MYINEYSNYWLSNSQDYGKGLFYILDENEMFFADLHFHPHNIRPVIKVKGDLIIDNGNGTKENPFIIGDKNVEEN